MGGLLEAAQSAAGHLISKRDAIRDFSNEAVNVISELMPGNVIIPSKAKSMNVFFVIDTDIGNYYVSGNFLSERERILKHLTEDFRYVMFRPVDVKDVGLPALACGDEHYEKYRTLGKSQLMTLKQDNPDLYYITCDDDIKYLELRLETLGIGKMYRRHEIIDKINLYIESAELVDIPSTDAMYQCILDIAMSL